MPFSFASVAAYFYDSVHDYSSYFTSLGNVQVYSLATLLDLMLFSVLKELIHIFLNFLNTKFADTIRLFPRI